MDGGGSVKKPRGRPRKYGPMLDPNSPTPQKKRGRPRKQRLADDVGNAELPLSVHTVVSDDDLLSEILVRLPVLSLVLFKSVSKRWLSLIKDAAFIKRRSRIPIIDPPSGLFVERDWETNVYGFASLDIRIRPRLENTFKPEHANAIVLQSCNGLFLCSVQPEHKYYVYNPTLNLFKMLPEPLYKLQNWSFTGMEFDPTKSPHYKVVHATILGSDYRFRIQTYSSETGIWSIVCSSSDPIKRVGFQIYWNGAIHRIKRDLHHKLDFVNESSILTKIQVPVTIDNYCKLFESRGCLLLLGEDKTHSDQLNVYEMRNRDLKWSFKYSVNLWRITLDGVWCISVGEREEDSFMVIEVNEKIGLYKFVTKTFCELPELMSMSYNRGFYSPDGGFLFIPSFASV